MTMANIIEEIKFETEPEASHHPRMLIHPFLQTRISLNQNVERGSCYLHNCSERFVVLAGDHEVGHA